MNHPTIYGKKNGGLGWRNPAVRKYGTWHKRVGSPAARQSQNPGQTNPAMDSQMNGMADCGPTFDDRQDVC